MALSDAPEPERERIFRDRRRSEIKLDEFDWAILEELQRDAARPVHELGRRVGLSPSACWKRIRRLEKGGVVGRRVVRIDPERVGLGLTAFVLLRTRDHSEAWARQLAEAVADIPEIVELHRTSGDVDYVLRVVVADVGDYDRVYTQLTRRVQLADVSASFSMEPIKEFGALPLRSASIRAGRG